MPASRRSSRTTWSGTRRPCCGSSASARPRRLRAITSAAAAVCGLGPRKGRIAPGFDADILAVDGDPISDPEALHRIRAVYARGTVVPGAGT